MLLENENEKRKIVDKHFIVALHRALPPKGLIEYKNLKRSKAKQQQQQQTLKLSFDNITRGINRRHVRSS